MRLLAFIRALKVQTRLARSLRHSLQLFDGVAGAPILAWWIASCVEAWKASCARLKISYGGWYAFFESEFEFVGF
jgi:hypothetical protein